MSHSGMTKDQAVEYKKYLKAQTSCLPTPTIKTQSGFKTDLYLFVIEHKDTKEVEKVVGYFYSHCPSTEVKFCFSNSTLLPSHYDLKNHTYIGNK